MRTRSMLMTTMLLCCAAMTVGCAAGKTNTQRADALYECGQKCEMAGKADRAMHDYELALRRDADHVPSLRAMAQIHTNRCEYDKAIPLYKKCVKASKESADSYNDLGYCQDMAGWTTEAEISYRKCLEIDPQHLFANVNCGMMLARHNRGTEGLCMLQRVLSPAEARLQLGLAYEDVGKMRMAQIEFRKALEIEPMLSEARAHLMANDEATAEIE